VALSGTSENDAGGQSLSVLVPFGVGPHLRFGGADQVSPSLAVLAHLAFDADADGVRFLPGVAAHAGVDVPLGSSPLALRPAVEVGNLARLFVLRAGVSVVVSL
jgi:hypothetical protein